MKLHRSRITLAGTLALAMFGVSGASASSSLNLETVRLDPATEAHLALGPPEVAMTTAFGVPDAPSVAPMVFRSVRWQPRRYREQRRDRWGESRGRTQGFSQIHAGFFDPDGDASTGFEGGSCLPILNVAGCLSATITIHDLLEFGDRFRKLAICKEHLAQGRTFLAQLDPAGPPSA